jgi:hypothetical protein
MVANQLILERGGTYIKRLEDELDRRQPAALGVFQLQHARFIVDEAYGQVPGLLAAVISQIGSYLAVLLFTGACIALMPWHGDFPTVPVSILCTVLYSLAFAMITWTYKRVIGGHQEGRLWMRR